MRTDGFTLLELLAALTLIGAVVALLSFTVTSPIQEGVRDADVTFVRQSLRSVAEAAAKSSFNSKGALQDGSAAGNYAAGTLTRIPVMPKSAWNSPTVEPVIASYGGRPGGGASAPRNTNFIYARMETTNAEFCLAYNKAAGYNAIVPNCADMVTTPCKDVYGAASSYTDTDFKDVNMATFCYAGSNADEYFIMYNTGITF